MRKQGVAVAYVRRDGAAKIAGQQNGAEHLRHWNDVEQRANQQHDSKRGDQRHRITKRDGAIDDRLRLEEFKRGIEQQKENRERAQYATCPKLALRWRQCAFHGSSVLDLMQAR